jgi:hypothetical protein
MNATAITAALDAALVAEQGFAPAASRHLPDPFPRWGREAA